MRKKQILLWIIIIASLIGLVASAYTIYAHYDTSGSTFCSVSDTFDCDVVNKSEYSKILGIPVGVLGVGGYGAMIILAFMYMREHSSVVKQLMILGAVFGLLFSLYLTAVEAFILFVWCLVCLTSQAAMITVAVSVFLLNNKDKEVATIEEIHE